MELENLIDNLIHGKDEDVFVRNARRIRKREINKGLEEKYGKVTFLKSFMPGSYAYQVIKNGISKDDSFSRKLNNGFYRYWR